jgi:hypothetical protein
MMNYAGIGEYIHHGRPNVAYLIQALRRGGTSEEAPVYGFDVFQVEQDQTISPEEPTMRYCCCVAGVPQEDTVISIPAASLGLTGDEQREPFMIALSHIRKELDTLEEVSFVPALEHEM